MGRGLGRIQRAILAIFTADPRAIRSTTELCLAVYGVAPAKRHRVAVLRALRSLDGHKIQKAGRVVRFTPGRVCERADDLWYNHALQTPSYGEPFASWKARRRPPS